MLLLFSSFNFVYPPIVFADAFTTVGGLHVYQPFPDVENVTVDHDKPSDRVLDMLGLFAPCPPRGRGTV